MFIGREKELDTLERAWRKDDFQFIVMYGRRRVGKSMLLTHFAESKRSIYHLAQETSPKASRDQFSQSVAGFTEQTGLHFESWTEALDSIAKLAEHQRLLLIIDEFPYLAESDPGLMSLIQSFVDTTLKNRSLLLILCGSTIGFMEREVLGAKSPLFGRRTGQMKIEPFDYLTASRFVPDFTSIDKALTYSIFGGTPHYLVKLDDKRTIADNIIENVLDPHSYLYDEPILLLKQELREPAIYNSVIEAIASGSSRLNEIATRCGEDTSKCGKYLDTLIDLGFVVRETPIGSKPSGKKTLYTLSEPFFIFWYLFVFPNRTIITRGLSDFVLENEILPHLNQYAGRLFERICADFLHTQNREKKLPFVFRQLGKWWGSDKSRKAQVEIDIVALGNDEALICECKWTNEPIDMQVFRGLIEKGESFPSDKRYYALLTKSGFTQAVIQEAEKQGVSLYTLDNIFDV